MFKRIPFDEIEDRHVAWLAASLLAAPEDDRPEASDLLRSVMLDHSGLFEFDGGVVLVTKIDNRLRVDGFGCDTIRGVPKMLTQHLRELAAANECDTIVTFCYDRRLASVIKHLGGCVESVTLVLPVEPANG